VSSAQKPTDILDDLITAAAERGIVHRVDENEALDGRTVRIGGREMIHFGSCSYLGLELDPRLKQGAAEAARRFGTHYSCSRAYLSASLYTELEALLEQMFQAHVVVAPTTTLAHLAALPVLCESDDALLLDHQAHNSLHMASNQVRALGARVELVRHGRLDLLEERIDELSRHRRRIWYVGDGVYSMYGELAPVHRLVELAERWEQLHLYLDDAHGISWRGSDGRGYVLDEVPLHERMVVATTLAKSFGTGGSVLVFPNAEWRRKVRTCGGPMIFSGPLAPPVLGSAIASAQIHLSPELDTLQRQLRERIVAANEMLLAKGLPLVSRAEVPIRFVGASLPSVAQTVAGRLMERGFFPNVAFFPAVGMKRAGIRFTLTLHQSLDVPSRASCP
jgi:7-keto-8-aminopelargonate synthetase-like enzyme